MSTANAARLVFIADTRGLTAAIRELRRLQDTINGLRRDVRALETQSNRTARAIQGINTQANRMAGGVDNAARGMNRLNRGVANLRDSLLQLAGPLLVAFGGVGVQRSLDDFLRIRNLIDQAVEGSVALEKSQRAVADIARQTGSSYEATGTLFARLARSMNQYADSAERAAKLTRTITQGFAISGATDKERNSAIIQLTQGFSSQILQGDELRSVREAAPVIAKALADYFNTTVGGLKVLGSEGLITDKAITAALEAAEPKIKAAFESIQLTIAQSFQNILTSVGQAIQSVLGGGQAALVKFLNNLASQVDLLEDVVRSAIAAVVAFGAAWTAVQLGSIVAGVVNLVTSGRSLAGIFKTIADVLPSIVALTGAGLGFFSEDIAQAVAGVDDIGVAFLVVRSEIDLFIREAQAGFAGFADVAVAALKAVVSAVVAYGAALAVVTLAQVQWVAVIPGLIAGITGLATGIRAAIVGLAAFTVPWTTLIPILAAAAVGIYQFSKAMDPLERALDDARDSINGAEDAIDRLDAAYKRASTSQISWQREQENIQDLARESADALIDLEGQIDSLIAKERELTAARDAAEQLEIPGYRGEIAARNALVSSLEGQLRGVTKELDNAKRKSNELQDSIIDLLNLEEPDLFASPAEALVELFRLGREARAISQELNTGTGESASLTAAQIENLKVQFEGVNAELEILGEVAEKYLEDATRGATDFGQALRGALDFVKGFQEKTGFRLEDATVSVERQIRGASDELRDLMGAFSGVESDVRAAVNRGTGLTTGRRNFFNAIFAEYEEGLARIRTLFEELKVTADDSLENNAALATLEAALEANEARLDSARAKVNGLASSSRAAAKDIKTLAESLSELNTDLTDSIFELTKMQQALQAGAGDLELSILEETLRAADSLAKDLNISLERALSLLGDEQLANIKKKAELEQQNELLEEQRDLRKTTYEDAIKANQELLDAPLRNFQEGFDQAIEDFWRKFVRNGEDAFSDLGDFMKNIFQDVLADVLRAAFNPITSALKQQLSGLVQGFTGSVFQSAGLGGFQAAQFVQPILPPGYVPISGGGAVPRSTVGLVYGSGGSFFGGGGGLYGPPVDTGAPIGSYAPTFGQSLQGFAGNAASLLALQQLSGGGGPGLGLGVTALNVFSKGGLAALLSPMSWLGAAGGLTGSIGAAIGGGLGGLIGNGAGGTFAGAGGVIGGLAGNFLGVGMLGSSIGQLLGLGSGNAIQDSIVGGLGGVAGGFAGGSLLAGLGSVAGPVGALVGSLLGTALSGLFGGKSYPFAFADVANVGSYGLEATNFYSKHGGSKANEDLRKISESADEAIRGIVELTGGTFRSGTKLGLGYSEESGGFFVNLGSYKNTERVATGLDSAEEALGALYNTAIKFGEIEGGDEAMVKLVKSLASANVEIEDTARILDAYVAATSSTRQETSEWQRALSELRGVFDPLIEELKGVAGASAAVAEVTNAYKLALEGLRDGFNQEIEDQINQKTNPLGYEYEQIIKNQATRIKDATDLGADLNKVYELNNIEIEEFIEKLVNGADSIQDISVEFEKLMQTAKDLGRSTEELNAIQLSMLEAQRRLAGAFDDSIARDMLRIANPTEAALRDLLQSQANRLESAQKIGANVAAVERLNALELQEFIKNLSEDQKRALGDTLGIIEDYTGKMGVVLSQLVGSVDDSIANVEQLRQDMSQRISDLEGSYNSVSGTRQTILDNFGPQTPLAKLEELRDRFGKAQEAALSGDPAAAAELSSLATEVVNRSRALYGSSSTFYSDVDTVTAALDEVGQSLKTDLDDAKLQLEALDEQTEVLRDIYDAITNPESGLEDFEGLLEKLAPYNESFEFLKTYIELFKRQLEANDILAATIPDAIRSQPLPPPNVQGPFDFDELGVSLSGGTSVDALRRLAEASSRQASLAAPLNTNYVAPTPGTFTGVFLPGSPTGRYDPSTRFAPRSASAEPVTDVAVAERVDRVASNIVKLAEVSAASSEEVVVAVGELRRDVKEVADILNRIYRSNGGL